MIFTVTVARIEYRSHDFKIDAETPEQAEELARIAAKNVTDWKLAEAEQFVNEVITDEGLVVYTGR
jgi:hypothetical protein